MDMQSAFNIAIGLAGVLGGWLLRTMQDNIKANGDKIQKLEVMIAGKYPTLEYLDKHMNAVFDLLRRIEDKIDRKADKP